MKLQKFLFLSMALAIIALTNSACVNQDTSLTSVSPNMSAEDVMTEDIEVHTAQKLIEKVPDSAEGYNKLAAVYIRKARETGDFSLKYKCSNCRQPGFRN
ncbi:MAG: hypothetical protein WKF71_17240 [Pyrinomonadaceae bacterium]